MSFYIITSSVPFKGTDVWSEKPTSTGVILYSFVTPVLCCCGIFGNTITLLVLKRKELVGSVYTYLAVLASVDLGTSVILMLGGISKGIMWNSGWVNYDSLVGLPLGSVLVTLGVLAIVGLTMDRVVYLWNPVRCVKPKYCNSWVARRIMIASFVIAIIFNLPYCFIYDWANDGTLVTTTFFDSLFYKVFNWITLFVFAIIPAVILLTGNGFIILSLRKARIMNEKSNLCRTNKYKRRDHTNLTITLVMIIIFFLITNIPQSLVSRSAAINLLFDGNRDKINPETLENIRQICTIIGAIDVNTNFIFYYTFCPAFCKALASVNKCNKKRLSNNLHVNVFVLNGKPDQITTKKDNKNLNKQVQKVLNISGKSTESGFTFNLENGDSAKGKRCDCITPKSEECTAMENNNYIPPFSTILEESSTTYSTNINDMSNKNKYYKEAV